MRISDWSSDVCSSDLLRQPLTRCLGQSAKRIAVEVDEAFAQVEAVAERRKRIGGVERRHVGGKQRVGHAISLKMARTGLASAPMMRSGSATSSDRKRTRLNSSH